MADTKITALAAIATVDPAADVLPIVDISDTSMAASGTTKKITTNQILGAGGTATLASATITGDLTVRTNKLAVTSTGVGCGTATPGTSLEVWKDLIRVNSDVASGVYGTQFWRSGVERGRYGFDFSASLLELQADGDIRFLTGGETERYRIDSTGISTWSVGGTTAMTLNASGLGVGVVAAAAKLQAAASALASVPAAGSTGHMLAIGSSPYGIAAGALTNGNSYIQATRWDGTATNYDLLIQPNGGNVGIGVTPSAVSGQTRVELKGSNGAGYVLRSGSTNTAARDWVIAANVSAFGDFVIRQGNSQGAEPNSGTDRFYIDPSGNTIFTISSTPPTLSANSQLTVNATSNTNLRFSYRGSDGVTRVANLTLA